MSILRRSLAPITEQGWEAIEEEAKRILSGNLSARYLVEFSGPHGWDLASVNTGALEIGKSQPVKGVSWGKRVALPMIETRTPFSLSQIELDSVSRGFEDVDLEPVKNAAQQAALFEEKAVYAGFDEGCIKGITQKSSHKELFINKKPETYVDSVETGIASLQKVGVGGPYAMVLGTAPYETMMRGDNKGYPLYKRMKEMLGGEILWSPAIAGAALLSTRGGDFRLTVGQDFSIGYESHTTESVNLYITESFTFQVLDPAAVIMFKFKA